MLIQQSADGCALGAFRFVQNIPYDPFEACLSDDLVQLCHAVAQVLLAGESHGAPRRTHDRFGSAYRMMSGLQLHGSPE
jgi:hypothetical protein